MTALIRSRKNVPIQTKAPKQRICSSILIPSELDGRHADENMDFCRTTDTIGNAC
jgi:hypothetical protein